MWTDVNELTTTVLKAEKRYLRTWPESSPKLELTPGRLQGDNFAVMEISSVPLVPETFPTARGLRPTPKHPTARETQTSGTHSYNLMAVLFQEYNAQLSAWNENERLTSPSGGFTRSILVVSKLDKSTDSWNIQLSSLTATLSTKQRIRIGAVYTLCKCV